MWQGRAGQGRAGRRRERECVKFKSYNIMGDRGLTIKTRTHVYNNSNEEK
jgi:hypothetical protein